MVLRRNRWAKVGMFITIAFCSGLVIFVIQSIDFDSNDEDVSSTKEDRRKLYYDNQTLIMPEGGDNVPFTPSWPIPNVRIINDPSELIIDPSSPHRQRYITTRFIMSPGQGNLMFQYAAIFGIAWRHNATVVIHEDMLLRRSFYLDGAMVASFSLAMTENWRRQFFAQCCRFYPEVEQLDPNRTLFALYGYFQSYKYFHTEDEKLRIAIRNQFRFLPDIKNLAANQLNLALSKWKASNRSIDPILVGVHVRRGLDMTLNSRNQQHGHTVANKDYFLKAMNYFKQKFGEAVFFIFCSDDISWTKENFEKLNDVYIVSSNIREVDMCVLSLCNHTIMSQGTFSWWAAYLAGGETIYYNGWPRPGSPLALMVKKEDFFLSNWIPMV